MKNSICAILLTLFSCFLSIEAATFSGTIDKRTGSSQLTFFGETIPTSSYLEKTFYDIGGYNSVSVYLASVSAGSITTANVIWVVPYQGTTKTLSSEFIKTRGRPYTAFKSDTCTVRVYSNQAQSVRVTGNILFRQNDVKFPKQINTTLNMTVPPSSTTFTANSTNQGYWFLRTDQKIYIDTNGGTATASDLFMNSNDALDLGFYISSGQTIRMKADATTANVSGYSYE